ncbi:hypothetical protein K469DRAFT_681921 [Zopfia rhizophila CBS 207.26]|uniref:VPS8-like TPR-like repeats domain-containing protein n=1 Tax=Zopfia rhizophila CBS 207.26 TaxID=1314779 RepID=A0A6A6EXH4_9PEZI|nr:hypothetical protein K469DRAFT_681921 [Zopfia rhizophila CBS 207.26]
MARDGLVKDAMDRLVKHLGTLELSPARADKSMDRSNESLLDRRKSAYGEVREGDLALDEVLWLDLVDTVVSLAKDASAAISELETILSSLNATQPKPIDTAKITLTLPPLLARSFAGDIRGVHTQGNNFGSRKQIPRQ